MSTATDVDLSEFEKLSKPHRIQCGVATAADRLSGKSKAEFEAALTKPAAHITHSAISAWLSLRSIKIAPEVVSRHRRKVCSCD